MGMIQGRYRSGFPVEAFTKALSGDFDGDFTVKPRVTSAVYLSHSTCPKREQDFIGTELGSGSQGHRFSTILPQGRINGTVNGVHHRDVVEVGFCPPSGSWPEIAL
jgi:hypothetical protein